MNAEELISNGFHIDRTYQAQHPIESLRRDEDELMFYHRSHLITTSILKTHQQDGKNILLVGHVSDVSPIDSANVRFSLLGANDRSLYATIDRGSTTRSRIEIFGFTRSVSLDALFGQTVRRNVESCAAAHLSEQTNGRRTVRLEIFPLTNLEQHLNNLLLFPFSLQFFSSPGFFSIFLYRADFSSKSMRNEGLVLRSPSSRL